VEKKAHPGMGYRWLANADAGWRLCCIRPTRWCYR